MRDSSDLSRPAHVAIIMDGNGRWAKERGLSRTKGHRAGADAVDKVTKACLEQGIPWLTLFAFSSENWNRPKLEVRALMDFLYEFLDKKSALMMEEGVRLLAIGELSRLPEKSRLKLKEVMEKTSANTRLNLVIALSYGSRGEITNATREIARRVAEGELAPDDITEEIISSHLYTAGMPDPDLLIRTSGEMRLSNFLLWQLNYAEMVIVGKYWPDFEKEDFVSSLEEYARRHRRFGRI